MKTSKFIKAIEDLGAEITGFSQESAFDKSDCSISFSFLDIPETLAAKKNSKSEYMEIKAVAHVGMCNSNIFAEIRKWCNNGEADKYVKPGQQVLIPHLKVPAVKDCEGEEFDEIDLGNVVITAVHVEPHRVVFNFEDILFRHDIDNECSGKPFEETPLGVYLAEHFTDALKEYTGNVKVSLLSKDNVFNKNSKDFMPYFKPIKNRIKALAFENDIWSWWLSNPYSGSAYIYCHVNSYGGSGYNYANYGYGVAPAFEFTADSE